MTTTIIVILAIIIGGAVGVYINNKINKNVSEEPEIILTPEMLALPTDALALQDKYKELKIQIDTIVKINTTDIDFSQEQGMLQLINTDLINDFQVDDIKQLINTNEVDALWSKVQHVEAMDRVLMTVENKIKAYTEKVNEQNT